MWIWLETTWQRTFGQKSRHLLLSSLKSFQIKSFQLQEIGFTDHQRSRLRSTSANRILELQQPLDLLLKNLKLGFVPYLFDGVG
ncbi:hypothetical protein L2E82_45575 [Cichorium intybus]|uniref:Uncharacterized protein n=1 Tax=Cichorium intybus TaxID=13427 RepID=A0ACB8ZSG6_CICIN|nr:hypothetical protein L2E82_45575 [Cichorium intybus]